MSDYPPLPGQQPLFGDEPPAGRRGEPPVKFRPTLDGTVSIPIELVRDESLTTTSVVMACALASFVRPGSAEVRATDRELAETSRLSRRTAQYALLGLVEAGWVVRHSRGSERTLYLRWLLPDDWSDLGDRRGKGVGNDRRR